MLKKFLVVCFLLISIINANAEFLRVGTNAEYAPFEFTDENGNLIGFDIDLTEAVAKQAGFEGVKWTNAKFDSLILSLMNKNFQAIAAGLVITEERSKKISFTKPYTDEGLSIVVRNNQKDVNSLKELEGKTIGAEIGTTSADLAKTIKGAKVIEFDSNTLSFDNLQTGKIDAMIQTEAVAKYTIKDLKLPLKTTSGNVLPKEKTNFVAFAVSKKDTTLLKKLNESLDELKKNGQFDKIYQKWFGK
jgi:polar amino acid transport system substrate-binding protein